MNGTGSQSSETGVVRCRFNNLNIGATLNTGNALNYWFRESYFADCGTAISVPWPGLFVKDCIFVDNQLDIDIYSSNVYGIRGCTSVGSQAFAKVNRNAQYCLSLPFVFVEYYLSSRWR